ncbi:hypothetical protein Hanom_Chr07g00635431 [Helianthus anomalus]
MIYKQDTHIDPSHLYPLAPPFSLDLLSDRSIGQLPVLQPATITSSDNTLLPLRRYTQPPFAADYRLPPPDGGGVRRRDDRTEKRERPSRRG